MTTIMGRILQDMNNRVGAGLFAELDDIDPCLVDEPAPVHSDTVGCALGGGNSEDTAQLHPLPDNWHKWHSIRCNREFRGCAPECPKRVYEDTGLWLSNDAIDEYWKYNSADTDDMPLCDCVEVCKRVTDEFHRHMAKMGIE